MPRNPYHAPTTGSEFQSKSIGTSAGSGGIGSATGIISLGFVADQQQAAWDQQVSGTITEAGLSYSGGIEDLGQPLFNQYDSELVNIIPGAIPGLPTEEVTSWIIPGTTVPLNPGDPGYPGMAPGVVAPGSDEDLGALVTGLGALTHPLDLVAVNGTFFLAGGGAVYVGFLAVAGGCFEPTPFEPLTCFAGALGGVPTFVGGVFLLHQGVSFFEDYTLPAIENWGGGE